MSESRSGASPSAPTRKQLTRTLGTGMDDDNDMEAKSGMEDSVASFGDSGCTDLGNGGAKPDLGYGVATPDLGYGGATPDLGYGDVTGDLGYGDTTPNLGYGDATPDDDPKEELLDDHDFYGKAPRVRRHQQQRASSMQHVSLKPSQGRSKEEPTPRVSGGCRKQRRRSNSMNMLLGDANAHRSASDSADDDFTRRQRLTGATRGTRRNVSMSMLRTFSSNNMGGQGNTVDSSSFVTGSRIRRLN
jgi:hypothetical protein